MEFRDPAQDNHESMESLTMAGTFFISQRMELFSLLRRLQKYAAFARTILTILKTHKELHRHKMDAGPTRSIHVVSQELFYELN
jgi:hypothetical protein